MARDGWMFVGPALIVALLGFALRAMLGPGWGTVLEVLGLISAGFFMYFFRDPQRNSPEEPGTITATADGRIVVVQSRPDGTTQIDTFLSVFNVHVNRAPVSGTVKSCVHTPGKYHATFKHEAASANERQDLMIESDVGVVASAQIAGLLARRIICRPRPGERIKQGDGIGMIRFGSRAEVIVPPGFASCVVIGAHVVAGETVLARRANHA